MGTFLTTPKMSPELALRIERRLSQKRVKSQLTEELARPQSSPRARALVLLALVAVGGGFYVFQAHEKRELARIKQEVRASLQQKRAALPEGYQALLPKVERWAAEAARSGGDDVVAMEINAKGDLDTWLMRPALYVRGPAAELSKPGLLAAAAAASDKDAFLLCLLRPPASRNDVELIAKVRGVNFGGALVQDATSNVLRFHHAQVGLSALSAAFEQRLSEAPSQGTVRTLAKELEHVPLEVTRQAAQAHLLIVVADDGPIARVMLVDLASDRLLLRIHRTMNAVRSSAVEKLYSTELSACELALDVRDAQ